MSAKNWADEYSSDEGSVDPEDEPVQKPMEKPSKRQAAPAVSQSAYAVTAPDTSVPFIAFVSSINFTVTRNEIGAFFESKGCAISRLDLLFTDDGKSKGSAVIEFKNKESLNICLGLNGEKVKGIQIRTKVYDMRPADANRSRDVHKSGGDVRSLARDGKTSRNDNDNEERFPGRRIGGGPPGAGPGAIRGGGRAGQGSAGDRERGSRERESAPAPVPASRPRIVLQPRSLPLETIGKEVSDATKPDIFGGGRPHDELVYEVSRFISKYILKTSAFVND